MGRQIFYGLTGLYLVSLLSVSWVFPLYLFTAAVAVPLIVLGIQDCTQKSHAILRNFPIVGHLRYIFEEIRPEIHQYFIESNKNGAPFSREVRSVVYQRAKKVLDTVPFGTQTDVSEIGYEWTNHSLAPIHVDPASLHLTVGGPACKQPYKASIFNISAMSFGALSPNAILALSRGAKRGGFAHCTGEGSISPYHLEGGADLIWQIGTGYFGARTADGKFDPALFRDKAGHANVKMIEIKLSQGAKPGHGGILPAAKITREIAQMRNVPLGKDVISPPAHSAFSSPVGLLEFVAKLRDLSGGKPVGFKLCVGKRREFLAICKAMIKTGVMPDYIHVDGGEGGTGAAPLEFTNFIGSPLTEGLIFVHNALVGFGVRDKIRIICTGKITTGFDIVKKIAMGADMCSSARAFLLSIGCIQALKCNTNHCPTGVATQNPALVKGLDPTSKAVRAYNYHDETLKSVAEILGAIAVPHTRDLRPWQIMRRVGPFEVRHYGELYQYLRPGQLLDERDMPGSFLRAWRAATPETFSHVEDIARAV